MPLAPPSARRTVVGALFGAACLVLAGCDRFGAQAPASFNSVDITGADYALTLKLPDASGRQRSLTEWQGQVVVVFFGYAQCPDVCPTTLTEIAQIKKSLGEAGTKVHGVFVTVDPERDTAEILQAYMANFGTDFTALRGTPQQTRDAAQHFKVFYAKVPGSSDKTYTIDHTAGAYVFDTQGRVRLFVRYGQPMESTLADIRRLLAEAQG